MGDNMVYTDAEKQAILDTLTLREGISADMVIDEVQLAWALAEYEKNNAAEAVLDKAVIKELQKIIDADDRDIYPLLEKLSWVPALLLAFHASDSWKDNPCPSDGYNSHAQLLAESTWSIILNADPDLLRTTAKAAIAHIEQARDSRSLYKPGIFYMKTIRRGRPVNYPAHTFADAAYRVFYYVTDDLPTRRINCFTNASYGPFHDFLEAAIGPTKLIQENAKVDKLVRQVTDEFKKEGAVPPLGFDELNDVIK